MDACGGTRSKKQNGSLDPVGVTRAAAAATRTAGEQPARGRLWLGGVNQGEQCGQDGMGKIKAADNAIQ